MSKPKPDLAPGRIGYWARIHNLSMIDVLPHYTLDGKDAQRAFRCGWHEADKELKAASLEALAGSLAET